MKQTLSILLIIISSTCFSQTKKIDAGKKQLIIVIDSADATKFFDIFNTGVNSLMTTSLAGNYIVKLQEYGINLINPQVLVYNSWVLRGKKQNDTTTHK